MVRLLLSCLLIIYSFQSLAADELYLSNSEKAVMSLGLKALLINKADEKQYLMKTVAERLDEINQKIKKTKHALIFLNQPIQEIQVNSYEEFLKLQKNEQYFGNQKLSQLDIDKTISLLEPKMYYSQSSKVQNKINKYNEKKLELKKSLLNTIINFSHDFVNNYQELSVENFNFYVKQKISDYSSSFSSKITEGAESTEKVGNVAYVEILAKLLKSYFEALPMSQKAEIVYRIMQMPLNSKPEDIFLTMIQHSGPQMQKLVQIIGRNPNIPKDFQMIFQKLESQVQPVPWNDVQNLLKKSINLNEYSYFEQKALGVGTMAQTHRAQKKVIRNGVPVNVTTVVRFLKPGIESLLEMDRQILTQIASEIDADPYYKQFNLPSLQQLVTDIHKSVLEELEVFDTAKNQVRGKSVYERQSVISYSNQKNILNLHVPTVKVIGHHQNIMEQEIIFGKKPESASKEYHDIYPELYPVVSQKVAESWIEESFFKSGFFHADLHQGNMLMKVSDHDIQVNILDFGMVGQLSELQKRYVVLLALAIKMNHAELIAESFSQLTRYPLEYNKKIDFEYAVVQRVAKIKSGEEKPMTLENWTAWAFAQGIDLHYEFIKLNRGITAITGLLHDSKAPSSFEEVAVKVALKNTPTIISFFNKQKIVNYSEFAKFSVKFLSNKVSSSYSEKNTPSNMLCKSLFN